MENAWATMDSTNHLNHEKWEKRSVLYGPIQRSVLFKGMPDIINEHIHNWHKKIVLKNIAKKKNMRVLDIGCGYGRLSMPVIDEYPETELLGIDITETFVKFYQEMTKAEGHTSDTGKYSR